MRWHLGLLLVPLGMEVILEASLMKSLSHLYGAICSSNPDASFCDHEDYIKAQAALSAALQTAQDAIAVSGNVNSATILNLIHTLEMDWNTYNSIIKSVKAKKAAYDKARLTP